MSKHSRNRQLSAPRAPSQQTIVSHQQLRIAPIPSPEELARFEEVLPGLANRIMRQAELNGEDRRRTSRTIRWATIIGQLSALVVALSAIGTGFYLVNTGKDAAGIAAIVATIAAPLGVFIYNRTKSN